MRDHTSRSAGVSKALLIAILLSAPLGLAAPFLAAQTATSQLAAEAKRALADGDWQAAIRVYHKLVTMAPRDAAFHEALGIAHYTSGDPQSAVGPLSQALKLAPTLASDKVFSHFFGASLAETGRCAEALPYLSKSPSGIEEPALKRALEMDAIKCAMRLDREDDLLRFLAALHRDFPNDPEALYLTVHVYSDLSTRAAQRLLTDDPAAYQVHELAAESLEAQGKWSDAESEYRRVLEIKPGLPGIHYLIGRDILSAPATATTFEDAQKEFEAELKIDPRNAGAEFVLGEIARKQSRWEEAIQHFELATDYDPAFAPAFVELGRTFVTTGKGPDAIAALEKAVKLSPGDPEGHYLLATAYRRAGRAADANRELVAYERTSTQAKQNMQDIRSAVTGRKTPAETTHP